MIDNSDTTLGELQAEFGFEVAELVYWLSDLERGSHSAKTLMTAMRLSRAPMPAKLIKLADIIDNARAVRPDTDNAYLAEKREVLTRMADVEGQKLTTLPLFRVAR